MRSLSVAISVAVHGTMVAAFAAYAPPERPAPEAPPITVEIVPVEPSAPAAAPLEVAIAELRTPAASAPAPSRAPARRRTAAAPAITTTTPSTVETPAAPPGHSSLFDMRKVDPSKVDLRLPTHLRDDLDHVPAGTGPDFGPPPTGQLQESGGGRYRAESGAFTAKVDPDGSVTLKDRPNFRFGLALPSPKKVAQGVTDWYYSDKGPDGKRGKRTLEREIGGSIDSGNEATGDPGDRSRTIILPVLRGGFDLTDALMRGKKQDPYASAKLRFLDSTRDERVAIGTRHRAQQLAQTAQFLQRNIDALWARTLDPAARKEALFELWDECVEAGDELVLEASRSARNLVVAFVRTHLPAGSADAYSAGELAALNARRQSKSAFAPYE